MAACAHGARDRPGTSDARVLYYTDNSGVSVTTVATRAEQPLSGHVTVGAQALVDHIVVERQPLDPSDPGAGSNPTGHPPHDPDVVTSASTIAGEGKGAEELRFEGAADLRVDSEVLGAPGWLRARGKVSDEPDYSSWLVALRGGAELMERNVGVSAYVAFGRDRASPLEDPAGQADLWPGSNQHLHAGAAVSQILGETLVASGGAGITLQTGLLSNPYRRAIVRTSLFPEVVPDTRARFTAFGAVSWNVGWQSALHAQVGLYADGWGVIALIPELSAVRSLGPRGLVALRYRVTSQSAAYFYDARYPDLESLMTGDPRLGPLSEHSFALDGRYTLVGAPREPGSLTMLGGYELTLLDYEDLATQTIVGHVAQLGLSVSY